MRFLLKQAGILSQRAAAPRCQTCHMQEGNHAVRTAWGFLAVRLPMPEDEEWAEAIRIVAGLYKESILEKPKDYAHPFSDLLTFHDAPTPIEQGLFIMFLKHRMRTFQGAFQANRDYAFWYGWSEMQQDLSGIKALAEELRRAHQ